jgi:hypothetical protein
VRKRPDRARPLQAVPEFGTVNHFTGPAVVLDAQGVSLLAEPAHHLGQRRLVALLKAYEQAGYVAGISVLTIAEERRAGEAGQRLAWWRTQLVRVPVSERIAASAGVLLDDTGLSGHRCVVDAVVVATAATSPEQARVLSSDGTHVPALAKAATARRRGVPVEFRKIRKTLIPNEACRLPPALPPAVWSRCVQAAGRRYPGRIDRRALHGRGRWGSRSFLPSRWRSPSW